MFDTKFSNAKTDLKVHVDSTNNMHALNWSAVVVDAFMKAMVELQF